MNQQYVQNQPPVVSCTTPPPVTVVPPPPPGYPVIGGSAGFEYHQNPPSAPIQTKSRGDGFWKGCCAGLCCCCAVEECCF